MTYEAVVAVLASVRAEAYVEALVQGSATDTEAADLIAAVPGRTFPARVRCEV